jgi:hypothetical protein
MCGFILYEFLLSVFGGHSYSEGCIYTQFCIYWHALVLEGVWVGDEGDEGMNKYTYIHLIRGILLTLLRHTFFWKLQATPILASFQPFMNNLAPESCVSFQLSLLLKPGGRSDCDFYPVLEAQTFLFGSFNHKNAPQLDSLSCSNGPII